MIKRITIIAVVVGGLLFAGLARADVVTFKIGQASPGSILRKDSEQLWLRTQARGTISYFGKEWLSMEYQINQMISVLGVGFALLMFVMVANCILSPSRKRKLSRLLMLLSVFSVVLFFVLDIFHIWRLPSLESLGVGKIERAVIDLMFISYGICTALRLRISTILSQIFGVTYYFFIMFGFYATLWHYGHSSLTEENVVFNFRVSLFFLFTGMYAFLPVKDEKDETP